MIKKERYIGVMSGTSLDGVDVVLVEIEPHHIRLLLSNSYPMPPDIRRQILAVCTGQSTSLKDIGKLDHRLGHLFAEAVKQLLAISPYQASDICAIGCHGQTVYHHPDGDTPFTIQLGDANIIAAQTGIDTVADFRRKDMALGGQGAPLVPAFHREVFPPHEHSLTVVLNLGGIANISVIQYNQPVLGYDTGPGNVLIDAWCQSHTHHLYDKDAELAAAGQVCPDFLSLMGNDPYFSAPSPKSTGREYFNLDWIHAYLKRFATKLTVADVQRTLCQLTVNTVCEQVRQYTSGDSPRLYVCGGGARNPIIMQELAKQLSDWEVATTTAQGIDSDWMEAMAFAWLAQRRLHHLPSNLPEVTGASRATSLGIIYHAI